MGQDTSRAALAARDIESQNYDQIAKDLRDELETLKQQHIPHEGSLRHCKACAPAFKTFHDQIVAYTAVLDASAKMHHQKDHYSMLSPYAREKVAEIKGIIECLMTEELVEEQHQKEKMRMQAPISRAASQQVSGHATPVPLSPNRAYPEPPRSPYRSSMQTYERAERPSRNTQVPGAPPFAEQPYYTPPPYQPADVPYSPAQSDGVFDPEAFPVPVSAGGPYSPAAATHFQTQGPSDTLGPTTGYETFQPHSKATHGRQPSNAATHPMIRSAHRVTPSLADAPPRPLQSVDPRDLETRLSKLPEPHMPEQGAPHHRSAHRTMPSMADGSHHTPGGIDPNKLHDRLSRSASPSPEPQHHRGESNHGGWAVLQSIGEDGCDPRASTETQNGNRYRSTDELGASNNHNTLLLEGDPGYVSKSGSQANHNSRSASQVQAWINTQGVPEESLESASSEDMEQHHIHHRNPLYEEETISVPYIAAKPAGAHESATRRLEGGMFEESLESTSSEDTEQHHIRHHNGLYEEQTISVPYIAAKPAPGKDAPVKLGAHEIATRRLEGGMPDMSREATFTESTKRKMKDERIMSNLYDPNAQLDEEEDGDDDDVDDDYIDMGMSTLVALLQAKMGPQADQEEPAGYTVEDADLSSANQGYYTASRSSQKSDSESNLDTGRMLTESEIARSDHTPASVPDTKGAEQLKMQMRQASKASHVATAATAHVHSHSPLNH